MSSPRARTLGVLAAVFGLIAVVLLLAKPVKASFADDPLLRLQGFDRAPGAPPTTVDCGSVPSSLRSTSPATLYSLARDDACQREGRRRLVAALAAGAVVLAITLVVVVASRSRDDDPLPVTVPVGTKKVEAPVDRAMGAAAFGGKRQGPSGPSERESQGPSGPSERESEAQSGPSAREQKRPKKARRSLPGEEADGPLGPGESL